VSLEQAVRWIKEKDDFLLTTHVNPDGDGLGAQSALYLALKKIGKRVRVVNRDPVPRCYRWLPYQSAVEVSDAVPPHQVCIVLDAGDLARVREGARRDQYQSIMNIDHHRSNTLYGDLNWIDPLSPATGEMVHRLIRALGIPFDKDIAESVYTSLVTDTGAFKYSNTTPQSHRLAAELMEEGAEVSKVCDRIFANVTRSALELLRLALVRLTTRENGRVGVMILSRDDFKKSGADDEDTENLVDFVRKLEGVEVAVFLKEREDGRYRLSLRSRNHVDVAEVAAVFGGGGHKFSAGAVLDGPATEAVERVVEVVTKSLR
jgi:bifunctional oligoribonuclease and PAP phosphatase NrnA